MTSTRPLVLFQSGDNDAQSWLVTTVLPATLTGELAHDPLDALHLTYVSMA
jgi:hypothetical protein